MAGITDDIQVQEKVDKEQESDRKKDEEKIVKMKKTEEKAKRSSKRLNVADVASCVELRARGVRPIDLAKHQQPFFIEIQHSDGPGYVKFKTTNDEIGCVETSKGWASGNGLFALEDAGSDKYYIKATNNTNATIGYLYLSDKKTGVFTSRNSIMWSKDKKDQANYKFEFVTNDFQRRFYRINCNGKFLKATSVDKGYLKAKELGPFEGFYELNMPNVKNLEIAKGEVFDVTQCYKDVHERYSWDNGISYGSFDLDLSATIEKTSIPPPISPGADSQILTRAYKMTVPRRNKMRLKMVDTLIDDVIEEELLIKIKGTDKEFIGFNIRFGDQSGTFQVVQLLTPLDEDRESQDGEEKS